MYRYLPTHGNNIFLNRIFSFRKNPDIKMSDEPLKIYLRLFDCVSRDDLYTKLKQIIKQFKPFDGRDKIEFSLAKFKQHEFGETVSTRIEKVVHECWYAYKTEQLSNYLKRNKPVVTYENPKLLELESGLEKFLYQHLFMDGIDLPGTSHYIH